MKNSKEMEAKLHAAMEARDYGVLEVLFKNGAKATEVEVKLAEKTGDIELIRLFDTLHKIYEIEKSPIAQAAKAINDGWGHFIDEVDFGSVFKGCGVQAIELQQPINPISDV